MKDPEVYGEIYRRYPEWVCLILIRLVGKKNEYKNSTVRFQKAFNQVPVNIYRIFQKPCELTVHLINLEMFSAIR
jgi:phosphatidate phosphatase APP1